MTRRGLIALLLVPMASVPGAAGAEAVWQYEPATALSTNAVPGLALRAPAFAACSVLRFGGGSNDFLYLFFDCPEQYERHDRMFVWRPGPAGPARLLRGSHRDGQTLVKNIDFEGAFGETGVKYRMDLSIRSDWMKPAVVVDAVLECTARHKARRCRFDLLGKLPTELGPTGPLKSYPLLGRPVLSVSWDRRYDPPALQGYLKVGKLKLIPGSGLRAAGEATVTGPGDKPVRKKRFRARPEDDKTYFLVEAGSRLKPARPYLGKITVDLSPLFPVLTGSGSIVLTED